MRSSTLDDLYVCDLIERSNLVNLEKLLIVVPGINNLPSILKISSYTFNFVLSVSRQTSYPVDQVPVPYFFFNLKLSDGNIFEVLAVDCDRRRFVTEQLVSLIYFLSK